MSDIEHARKLYKDHTNPTLEMIYVCNKHTKDPITGKDTKEWLVKRGLTPRDAECVIRMLLDHGLIILGRNLGFVTRTIPMNSLVKELYDQYPITTEDRVDGICKMPYNQALIDKPEYMDALGTAAAYIAGGLLDHS